MSDPAAKIVSDLAVLSDLFGFTTAECRLVIARLSGTALPNIARQIGVSYHTVRTLLARAMSRTDTRSQLELVMLAARSQAAWPRHYASPDLGEWAILILAG